MIPTDFWNFGIIISFVPHFCLISETQLAVISTLQNPGPHIRNLSEVFFSKKKVLRFFEEMLKRKVWETKKKAHLESKQLLMLG